MNIRNFKIKYMFVILSCFLLVGNLGIKEARAEALDSDIVTFPDSNLEAAVREKLAIPTGDITVGDMREMKGTFNASEKNISNLSGIEYAINLQSLKLWNNKIKDITPIENLRKLTVLDISGNYINSLEPLTNLEGLSWLDINSNNYGDSYKNLDITPLKNLTNLNYLQLGWNNLIGIDALNYLVRLETLKIGSTNITNINFINNMPLLKSLDISYNSIVNVDPLKSLKNLNELNCMEIEPNIVDKSFLLEMVSLNSLWIDNVSQDDCEIIKELKNLNKLWAKNGSIENLDWASNLPLLTLLDVGNNNIVNINGIKNLTELEYFAVDGNKVSDISVIGMLNNLNSLFLSSNQITSIPKNFPEKFLSSKYLFNLNFIDNEGLTQNQLTFDSPYYKITINKNNALNIGEIRNLIRVRMNTGIAKLSPLHTIDVIIDDPTFFDSNLKAIKSGTVKIYAKIAGTQISNTNTKTDNFITVEITDKFEDINNIDIGFAIDNSLEVTLGSNTVNFGEVSSLGGEVQSTTLMVTSSLPYDISTMAYDDFVGSLDSANIIPIDKISLDIDALGYKALTKNKTLNIGDSPSAINKIHNLNLKMGDTLGYKKDDYNTSIQFIVDTK